MQVCCPVCDTDFPIEAGLIEGDGKRLAATLAGLDPVLGRAVIGYLRLFKPAKTALRMARAAKLAGEVATLTSTGTVCRDERSGVRRPCTAATWAAGIEQMLAQRATLTLPLDGHNYLRAVVFGLADKADAAIERQREADARVGKNRPGTSSAGPSETPLERQLAWIEQMLRTDAFTPEQAGAERAKALKKYGGGKA